jgi:hypothetical protein
MRCAWLAIAVGMSGCSALLGIDNFETAGTVDAATDGIDGALDGVDAPSCFGTLSPICFASPPTGSVLIDGAFDTSTDSRCDVRNQPNGQPQLCVIAGGTILVSTTVVTGSRPLVLVAAIQIDMSVLLDASSRRGGVTGAGADDPACSAASGTNASNGGGGAAGGGLGAAGGAGGLGGNGAAGGAALPTPAITALRGGCRGGEGGDGDDPASGGSAGSSGGAVALIAGTLVRIHANAAIYASGAGGGQGNSNEGSQSRGAGGGGGSGGLIVLDAPSIRNEGTVTANGGGGGGGGDCCSGFPGADGTTTSYMDRAAGGLNEGNNHGGIGGDGGAAVAVAGSAGTAPPGGGGGGGGGGGVGVIWVKGTVTGVQFSPAPTLN